MTKQIIGESQFSVQLRLASQGAFTSRTIDSIGEPIPYHRLAALALPGPAAYNAGMGSSSAAETDALLRDGGLVVTASDRAARTIVSAYHRARRADGLAAWPAPRVLDWQRFVREAWNEQTADGRLLLNAAQEQSLWAGIVAASGHSAVLLEGPRNRLAAMAMEAHQLLCLYAPRFLSRTARSAWLQDAAAFGKWLAAFDEVCGDNNLLSMSRLPLELHPLLENDSAKRPPLLLAGFDRLLPIQRSVFDAWGAWREVQTGEPARSVQSLSAPDEQSELAACARWCSRQMAANPRARLLVITQDATQRRGEIERAFLRHAGPAGPPRFEFSLGIPLSETGPARSAHMLLRWLAGPLEENELDWLLSAGHSATSAKESAALLAYMRALRRRGLERTHWTLKAFTRQPAPVPLPPGWVQRMVESQRRLENSTQRPQTPLDWAALIPQLLETIGWPGSRATASGDFQIANRWQQVVETCGSLGFDGRRIEWREFLSDLARALNETLFAPESEDAPILIAGPAESAGLMADGLWFLGANEDAWPARGSMHPLLPIEVQREARMPHASPQLDWELADAITARLLASAPKINFSYARQKDGVDARPSRLVTQRAGAPETLPPELVPEPVQAPLTIWFADSSRIPLQPIASNDIDTEATEANEAEEIVPRSRIVRGGSTVLTSQSQCPFKAFATARLGAQAWEPAEAGLSASLRGQLLHAVMHAVWGGPPNGLRTLDELVGLTDRRSFVEAHVCRVLSEKLPAAAREQMPRRYLELEEQRLTRLISEWLEFELTRLPFTVAATEVDATPTVAGLTLKLRLDRVDRLNDGSLLVIDYKTGDVSPKAWELPRPDDVQLPLYAGFALAGGDLGGLVFAKIRTGNLGFAGRVGDAASTLLPNLKNSSALMKDALTAEQLIAWREAIEQLARDFLAGRAEVDPREHPKTCGRCGLQTICRIQELAFVTDDDTDNAEATDE